MAFKIEIVYGKKLGLPNFSNHFSTITISGEVEEEAEIFSAYHRLNEQARAGVDKELESAGFVPNFATYGVPAKEPVRSEELPWACAPAQRVLIENMVKAFDLKREDVGALAKKLFGKNIRALNNQQAARLTSELRKFKDGVPFLDVEEGS